MNRQVQKSCVWLCCALMTLTGCHPTQPFYFLDDGDLSHYVGVATQIEIPDVPDSGLAEVLNPDRPRSLIHAGEQDVWPLALEECVSLVLANSKVMRTLGGRVTVGNSGPAPDVVLNNPAAALTVYDPALQETDPRFGVESALAEFDAQLATSMFWENNISPRNVRVEPPLDTFLARDFRQEIGDWNSQIFKRNAYGGTTSLTNRVLYDLNNTPSRDVASDWSVLFDVEARQPLLARGGLMYNRIAGPAGVPGQFNGVELARINTDIRLADFEAAVRNLVQEVEQTYWNLYFAYRNLDTTRAGRDAALATWNYTNARRVEGLPGGDMENWAQALEQYYLFRGEMENALTEVYRAESRLRYLMGLTATDNRLIKPADEPTTARVAFDWSQIHAEAIGNSIELRQQKWRIKQRELELIASKNLLMPRLDLVGRYRWEGLGDDLFRTGRERDEDRLLVGTSAFGQLLGGDFQSNRIGFEFSMPIGFTRELATVRHQELLLMREKQRLADQELEVSHQMADAVRDYESLFVVTQTAFNRRVAAQRQVEAVETAFIAGMTTINVLLDAQRRLADANIEYYRALINYNLAITNIHFRRNTLLQYNNIRLAEGPWPSKAYYDAFRKARKRDASIYVMDGYTQPTPYSRGPAPQGMPWDATMHPSAEGQMPVEAVPLEEPIWEELPGLDQDRDQPPLRPALTSPGGLGLGGLGLGGSGLGGSGLGGSGLGGSGLGGSGGPAGLPNSVTSVLPLGTKADHSLRAASDLSQRETDFPLTEKAPRRASTPSAVASSSILRPSSLSSQSLHQAEHQRRTSGSQNELVSHPSNAQTDWTSARRTQS